MSKVIVTDSYLTGIANAIRGKLGVETTYKASQMASAIESIQTGIIPTGTKSISENGTYDVTNYSSAVVNVSGGGGGSSTILSGIDEPSSNIGIDGNIYIKYAGLPSSYTPVDYILSTGDQYIDTGVIPDTDTEIELDFEVSSIVGTGWKALFGAQSSNITRSFEVAYYDSSKYTYQRGSSYNDVYVSTLENTRYKIKTKNNVLYRNDTVINALDNCVLDCPVSIYLFLVHQSSGTSSLNNDIYKCYGTKIWQAGKLLRYFVPCKRNSDSVAGLFDIVNQQFYTSESANEYSYGSTATFVSDVVLSIYCKVSGSWTLIDGVDIDDVDISDVSSGAILISKTITENGTYDPADENANGYSSVTVNVSSGSGKNILSGTSDPSNSTGINGDIYLQYVDVPNGYTKLNYIESSGTQWIDTDVPARQQLKIVADIQFLGNTDQTFLGGNGNSTSVIYLGGNPNDRNCIYINYNNPSTGWMIIANKYDTNRHVFESSFLANEQIVKKDGVTIYSSSSTISGTTAVDNLCIFARSNHYNQTTAKLYELKIYDGLNNLSLINHYIPALRISDSAVGLYDIINDEFYDSDGTNAFISGQQSNINEIKNAFLKKNNVWQNLMGSDINDVNLGS